MCNFYSTEHLQNIDMREKYAQLAVYSSGYQSSSNKCNKTLILYEYTRPPEGIQITVQNDSSRPNTGGIKSSFHIKKIYHIFTSQLSGVWALQLYSVPVPYSKQKKQQQSEMNLQVWAMKMATNPGIHYQGPHWLKCLNHFHCIENIQDK